MTNGKKKKKKTGKKPGKPGGHIDPAYTFKPTDKPKIGAHRANSKKKKK
jgi:hypothetical protein